MTKIRYSLIFLLVILFSSSVYAQTYDFVTCGQDGRFGPSQSDCDPYYNGDNNVNVVGDGIQEWDVPQSGVYRVTAYGPSGLNQDTSEAGKGAIMQAEFDLNQGETLQIIAGQQSSYSGSRDWFGGSGGTYVVDSSDTPLIVAGGGAGHRTSYYRTEMRADTGTTGKDGKKGNKGTNGGGGINPSPGDYNGNYQGGGGSGWSGAGSASPDDRYDNTINSETFLQGGLGGYHEGGDSLTNDGGFGGGGAAGWGDAGGGGGYSGGAPNARGPADGWGGGAGSFIHSSASNAATSDGTFSTTGNEPHNPYGGGVNDLNNWRRGDGRVEITLITNPDDPLIQNVNFDRQAGDPATIDGDFDVNIDDDGGNAPNNQLESCTVTAEGVDSGGQVNLNTNINGDSCSFSVANNDHGNWNPDEELRFDMSVEDSYSGTDNLQSFRQFRVNPPNAPAVLTPTDEASSVSTGTSLEVRGRHPDGLDMDIRFYLDDGNGFSQVGPTRTATDGEEVSVSPNLNEGTDYTWYAEAETQGRTTESNRWDFETNHRPQVQNMQTSAKASGHRMSFTSTVTDQDGRDQIDSCELEASAGGSSNTYVATVENGDGPNEARCNVDNIDFNDASWSHLENLDLELSVTDSQGLTDSDTDEGQFPNHRPVIETLETREYTDREAFEVDSLIRPVDVGPSEMRGCTIVLSDEDNSYTAGSMTQVNSTHFRCEGDDLGPSKFPRLDMDEELEVTVRATDIHGSTSSDSVMFNLPTGIDYRYSAMIIDSGGVEFLPYQVSNNGNGEAEFRTELRNVEASFTGNGQDNKTFTLDSGDLENSEIRISPDVGFTGTKELRIVTENLDTGVRQESTLPIHVKEAPTSTERPVPGIGVIQLLALVFAAMTVFYMQRLRP